MDQLSRRKLKAKAHHLDPVIIIGAKGLTDGVRMETDRALETHELIKVKINANDRNELNQIASELAKYCNALLVQVIGHIAILYRKRKD